MLKRNSEVCPNFFTCVFEFSDICDWFVDNKLSIHFGEDKTNAFFLYL